VNTNRLASAFNCKAAYKIYHKKIIHQRKACHAVSIQNKTLGRNKKCIHAFITQVIFKFKWITVAIFTPVYRTNELNIQV
jgi:hypothetical protein